MAVLNPHAGRQPALLLACREGQLDSLLALRRVAAHLGDLPRTVLTSEEPLPRAALVCDEGATTARLTALGVPVLHLVSAPAAAPAPAPAALVPVSTDRLLSRAHWPGWLEHRGGARPTGLLAPARLARGRNRRGTLLLLSLWQVPQPAAEAFTTDRLPLLARESVRRTGSCTVVCDTATDLVRAAVSGLADVTADRAADVDVDALHARAELLIASPTLAAVALAQARRAPLVFLPPLGAAQHELAEQITRLVPVPSAADPADPAVWQPPPADAQWAATGPELDDLRGAQHVARTVRQLLLAPL
ncbi:CGA synthase-related protein [Kitasatospora sp. NPDC086801]|uniref:CGA synthase-related protein n=1 Tax=Kitasatospora sp. NPDC086801 TaxID=3364066 RepID=UPI00382A4C81